MRLLWHSVHISCQYGLHWKRGSPSSLHQKPVGLPVLLHSTIAFGPSMVTPVFIRYGSQASASVGTRILLEIVVVFQVLSSINRTTIWYFPAPRPLAVKLPVSHGYFIGGPYGRGRIVHLYRGWSTLVGWENTTVMSPWTLMPPDKISCGESAMNCSSVSDSVH